MELLRTVARRAALLAALCLAAPAAAELYRWTDAQGREHFAMNLHEVPPEHRAQAQRRVELEKIQVDPAPEPTINTMKTPPGTARKPAPRPRHPSPISSYAGSTPAAAAVRGDAGCSDADRQEADRLARAIERWTQELDQREERQRRLVETDDRLRNEHRIEDAQAALERAEQALDDFETRMRRKGVPPGCFN